MSPHIRVAATFAVALLSVTGCTHHCPVPATPTAEPAKPTAEAAMSSAGLEYVGGTAIQAKDPKTLSAWYNERFGLPMKGEMGTGFYGGFEWNGTTFNIAIVPAGGKHPGSAPGTAYLVFHVGDYDRFVAAAAAKGVTPFETSSEDYGRFASFRDPEGNEVGVWGEPSKAH
ncbi:MAG TPA: VOC family protein [Kofleriaceae bacterium]|nr:VOC family protein [Kofleriaceae bacterium]